MAKLEKEAAGRYWRSASRIPYRMQGFFRLSVLVSSMPISPSVKEQEDTSNLPI